MNLTFNYNSTTTGLGVDSHTYVPDPTAMNVDYWGYANSAGNTNTSLLPPIDINPSSASYERYRNKQVTASPSTIYTYSITGANRQANTFATIGALSK